jgi:cystathionine gamma-synthase
MKLDLQTRCIHGDKNHSFHDPMQAVSFPLYQTSSFGHFGAPTAEELGLSTAFTYSRQSNPTRQRLEEVVSSLEGAVDTVAFSSGMAAISLCFELFQPNDHIICAEDLYGGVIRLFQQISQKNGLKVDFADTTNIDNIAALLRPETRALYVETPSNPMMTVTDLRACAQFAHEHNLLLIVDNTFLSPYFQNPLALGADLVIHSGSKFLCGHNDVIAGFLSTSSKELAERIRYLATTIGGVLSPFDCWLMLRGIKTLSVRMERQQENAGKIARWLKNHPKVKGVFYVGLPEHPGYELNRSQSRGAGSMISFHVDSERTARKLLERLRLIIFAESLGGTESLITYPMFQTHTEVPADVRERLGITETLLRLSVGLESAEDLIADLQQALED